ncbi:hypothetical protein QZH41_010655 [Actinostola sp. cb2023]|nr:hypothetical protein QZH41_010655 [Actinostola sp. cb2023]
MKRKKLKKREKNDGNEYPMYFQVCDSQSTERSSRKCPRTFHGWDLLSKFRGEDGMLTSRNQNPNAPMTYAALGCRVGWVCIGGSSS